ncbi:MAG: hypothetical protein IPI83_13240 [Sphingomonadales bacterium]|nr:hypothetical protein [Sphingomonadales bacterium]
MKTNEIMDMAQKMGADLPDWAEWLLVRLAEDEQPVRHRVLFGGRGGGKSWAVAICLVLRAYTRQEHILCLREFQNSIRDSSKKLIEDVIRRLGLGDFSRSASARSGEQWLAVYLVGSTERTHRSNRSKVHACLGRGGRDACRRHRSMPLIPTIRRPGSEIWWTYNPRFPTDPIDRMFRGDSLPPGTIRLEVHWNDNPWFPEVLQREMEYDRRRDPDKYAHIWLGGICSTVKRACSRTGQLRRSRLPKTPGFSLVQTGVQQRSNRPDPLLRWSMGGRAWQERSHC